MIYFHIKNLFRRRDLFLSLYIVCSIECSEYTLHTISKKWTFFMISFDLIFIDNLLSQLYGYCHWYSDMCVNMNTWSVREIQRNKFLNFMWNFELNCRFRSTSGGIYVLAKHGKKVFELFLIMRRRKQQGVIESYCECLAQIKSERWIEF